MQITYSLFGKEVHHPVLKSLAVVVAVLFAIVLLVFLPLLIPGHFILRKMGRKGFYCEGRVDFGKEAFAPYIWERSETGLFLIKRKQYRDS